jgi:polyvinyl alcohol dehydrogenase (cytochrome)
VRLLLAAALLVVPAAPLLRGAEAAQVSCAAPQRQAGEWRMLGGDVTSSRSQPREKVIGRSNVPLLAPEWTFDANRSTHVRDNEVTGYPVVADGCVYVGSSTGNAPDGSHLPGWVFALNADTGDVVWQTKVDGGVYSTVAVGAGVVYAFVSRISSPYVVALDQATGRVLWQTTVDRQIGSDAVSSPVLYDGMLWVGVSGTAAETSAADRTAFQGSSVLLATRSLRAPSFRPAAAPRASGTRVYRPGEIIRRAYSIPISEWRQGYAGAAQWGTIAIDPTTGYGYEGTGNPFSYEHEHRNTNAVLKLDLRRSRTTFGQFVGSYKGDVEAYLQGASGLVPCRQVDEVQNTFSAGLECVRLDLDFGATPNIVTDASGRRLVVVGQKSGVVHFIDARTMKRVRMVRLGVPSPVGGMVGSGATDGKEVYGTHTVGGYLYDVSVEGTPRWVTPVADGVHWGPPVTLAHGLLYTVDLKGFVDVYDAQLGVPLVHRPLQLGSDVATLSNPPLSWGGVTVARNTAYVSVGLGITSAGQPSMPDGFVIALRVPR